MLVRKSGFVSAGLLCLAFISVMAAPLTAADKPIPVREESVAAIQSAPIIAEPVSVRMAYAGDRAISPVVREARNISLDFHAADITDVLKALAMQSGTNIVTGTDVKGPVTVSLNRVSLHDALDMITKLSGYKYAEMGRDTYVVGSLPGVSGVIGDGSGGIVSEAFALAYADPDQLGKILESQFTGLKYTPTGVGPDKVGPKVLVLSGPKSLVDSARTVIAQVEGSLRSEVEGQAVEVVTLKYISAKDAAVTLATVLPRLTVTVGPGTGFDQRPPAGVTFVEYSGGGAGASAADQKEEPRTIVLSGSQDDVQKARRILVTLDTKPKQVLIEAKVADITSGAQKRLGITWSWTSFIFDEGTETDGGGSGAFDRLPITIEGQLDAMLKNNSANLLANPTVAALEGKPATIFIGDEIKYIIRIEETLTGVNFQTETANVGVTLRVVARPDEDGFITLALHPEVSTIADWLTIGTGTGGNNAKTAIALPQIARRFTDHVVRVKDGETIAIGGLIKDSELQTLTKIPLLGDLPFFGGLFRHREKVKEHSEIAIFLKATVMEDT